jgi:altered-inheritance-of-mitochondria protein 5
LTALSPTRTACERGRTQFLRAINHPVWASQRDLYVRFTLFQVLPLTDTKQLGGFTLTSAVLYITISLHTQNRLTQAALLRQQRSVLTNVIEPPAPEPVPVTRVVPVGLFEMAKDRWNRELESAVRRIYETDWRRVREDAEDRLNAMAEKLKEQK